MLLFSLKKYPGSSTQRYIFVMSNTLLCLFLTTGCEPKCFWRQKHHLEPVPPQQVFGKPDDNFAQQVLVMGITVHNISTTSAKVSWPSSPSCLDTFYSVMYNPNWNTLFLGDKRKNFMHEERIPVSQTSTHLANLTPHTAYFLCVTCQAANPVRDQCQVFSTLSENGEGHDRAGWELAMSVWLTCCILLLVISGILLWGCLHTICTLPSQINNRCPMVTNSTRSGSECLYAPRGSQDSAKHGAIIQPPLLSAQASGHTITQDHELRTLAKLSGSEPAWINWIKVITALFHTNQIVTFFSTDTILFLVLRIKQLIPEFWLSTTNVFESKQTLQLNMHIQNNKLKKAFWWSCSCNKVKLAMFIRILLRHALVIKLL